MRGCNPGYLLKSLFYIKFDDIHSNFENKIEARTIPNFDFLLCSYSLIKGPVYTCETITLPQENAVYAIYAVYISNLSIRHRSAAVITIIVRLIIKFKYYCAAEKKFLFFSFLNPTIPFF